MNQVISQTLRRIQEQWQALAARDGAGVHLKRALGASPRVRLDPFLMLDCFSSDDPNDYIAGFPAHPHRGFETITYIVDGHMKHKDHLGNEGDLKEGGVQWMMAGRGIIHEEMPQQKDGLLRGFQIWLNLPAKDKMQPAYYRDIPASEMPWQAINKGAEIKMIAGQSHQQGNQQVLTPKADRVTAPIIADFIVQPDAEITVELPQEHQAMLYVYEGSLELDGQVIPEHGAVTLSLGKILGVSSSTGGRFLLLAGSPLHEPIVQHGPFVMNTEQEIYQAIEDYRNGTLTHDDPVYLR